jgi:hypothetical protein
MAVRTSNAAVGAAVAGILIWLCVVGTMVYVAAHFIGKFW